MENDKNIVSFIGFGEAAMAFTPLRRDNNASYICAFDIKTDLPITCDQKREDYIEYGVDGASTLASAVSKSTTLLSLVTASDALDVAREVASLPDIKGKLYCDMNSIAPATKRQAAAMLQEAGAVYVDVAIMSPVLPGKLSTPLLLAGESAQRAKQVLSSFGFSDIAILSATIGEAAAIKMVRSIIIKGMEALTAEAFLAAKEANILPYFFDFLDPMWQEKAGYNLERMTKHGERRAAEMSEVVKMLETLGLDASMSSATEKWQANMGNPGQKAGLTLQTDIEILLKERERK